MTAKFIEETLLPWTHTLFDKLESDTTDNTETLAVLAAVILYIEQHRDEWSDD